MTVDVQIHALEATQLSRSPSLFHGPNSVTAHHLHNIDNKHTFLRMHISLLMWRWQSSSPVPYAIGPIVLVAHSRLTVLLLRMAHNTYKPSTPTQHRQCGKRQSSLPSANTDTPCEMIASNKRYFKEFTSNGSRSAYTLQAVR